MAPPLQDFSCSLRKVLLLLLVLFISLFLFTCSSMFISSPSSQIHPQKHEFLGRRSLLEVDDDEEHQHQQPIKKKKISESALVSSKNQTKIIKVASGLAKNQTKLMKTVNNSSSKNQTKILKLSSEVLAVSKNKTKLIKPTLDSAKESNKTIKSQFKKLNSTSKSLSLAKNTTLLNKKSLSDLPKTNSTKNKTEKPITTKKETKSSLLSSDSNLNVVPKSKSPDKKNPPIQKPKSENIVEKSKQTTQNWIDLDDEEDLVSGFRDLPSKFQESLFPDLERISKTSKVYLNKANKEMTKGFKPYVGNKYAPTIASAVSLAIIIIPLLLVSLIFNRFKAYFSLQKILIFIQIYLSIYFTILCLSSLATGLEPLKFLYATSQSTYVCLQVMQTLAYVLYLLLLMMYLILVFSTDTALATKLLSLGQIFVGFAVGLHYYVTVFHRAILRQTPKTSWRVHGIYATCFLLICLLTRADRRKKAYLAGDGDGDEGKLS